jgi:hypothetical protein
LRNLIIVSGSARVAREPAEPVPALQRFDGIFTRLIRKYHKQLRGFDILIVSPIYGLVTAEQKIGFRQPVNGSWRDPLLADKDVSRLRESSLLTLRNILARQQYDEIYVNVGKNMLRIIDGFEKMAPRRTRITYAEGPGIGPKLTHMKKWIESHVHEK